MLDNELDARPIDRPSRLRRSSSNRQTTPNQEPIQVDFFFPDSQDQIDPIFDFEAEGSSMDRVRQRDDRYAHEVIAPAPYTGILLSKALVDGPGSKYTFAQRHAALRGVRSVPPGSMRAPSNPPTHASFHLAVGEQARPKPATRQPLATMAALAQLRTLSTYQAPYFVGLPQLRG